MSAGERALIPALCSSVCVVQADCGLSQKKHRFFKFSNAPTECATTSLAQSFLHAADAHRHLQHPLMACGLLACSQRRTALGARAGCAPAELSEELAEQDALAAHAAGCELPGELCSAAPGQPGHEHGAVAWVPAPCAHEALRPAEDRALDGLLRFAWRG